MKIPDKDKDEIIVYLQKQIKKRDRAIGKIKKKFDRVDKCRKKLQRILTKFSGLDKYRKKLKKIIKQIELMFFS